jgi:hypothetical protein
VSKVLVTSYCVSVTSTRRWKLQRIPGEKNVRLTARYCSLHLCPIPVRCLPALYRDRTGRSVRFPWKRSAGTVPRASPPFPLQRLGYSKTAAPSSTRPASPRRWVPCAPQHHITTQGLGFRQIVTNSASRCACRELGSCSRYQGAAGGIQGFTRADAADLPAWTHPDQTQRMHGCSTLLPSSICSCPHLGTARGSDRQTPVRRRPGGHS